MASDVELVSALYEQLTAAGIRVWWDKKCLRPAQKWEDGFVDGMLQSVMIVPVLSRKLLTGFEKLTAESACDNVRSSPHHSTRAPHSDRDRSACVRRRCCSSTS